MPTHEKYQMMCALAAAGQLEPDEIEQLMDHATSCAECAQDLEEFKSMLTELEKESPSESVSDASEDELGDQRFLEFAQERGISFSREAAATLSGEESAACRAKAWTWAAVSATALLGFAASAMIYFLPKVPAVFPVARLNPVDLTLMVSEQQEKNPQVGDREAKRAQEQFDAKLAALLRQNNELKADLAQRDSAIGSLQATIASQSKQHTLDAAMIVSLNQKNESVNVDLVTAKVREADLNEELQAKQEAVDQERQLSAVSKDVRELMGARRLFMIDVYDGEDIARAKRSFGRIFYTQGKSLIFYAFDLDKNRNIKTVSFKAWGQKGKDPTTVKSLGVFHMDDAAQKRWVMKVDDPEKLTTIDAVFVTVESSPAVDRPSGQKLMYAYLGGQPNHP